MAQQGQVLQLTGSLSFTQAQVNLQSKFIGENGTYTPDENYDGFSDVTVDVQSSGGGEALDGLIVGEYMTTGIEISTTANQVRAYAFYGVTGLSKLTFADDVQSIGAHAFENLRTSDDTIHFTQMNPPTFDPLAFGETPTIRSITVPDAALESYNDALESAGIESVIVASES